MVNAILVPEGAPSPIELGGDPTIGLGRRQLTGFARRRRDRYDRQVPGMRRKRGTSSVVQASVQQRIEISIVVLISQVEGHVLDEKPQELLQLDAPVVVGTSQSFGRCWAKAKNTLRRSLGTPPGKPEKFRPLQSTPAPAAATSVRGSFQLAFQAIAPRVGSRVPAAFEHKAFSQVGLISHALSAPLATPVTSFSRPLSELIEGTIDTPQPVVRLEEDLHNRRVDVIAPDA